jgi:cyclohexanecarboxylate-CoA ligase
LACNKALSGRFGLTTEDVLLARSPVGHMTGYAAYGPGVVPGATCARHLGRKRGVTLMAAEGVTYTAASSPFLSDIAAVPDRRARIGCARSCAAVPIPPVLIERAAGERNLSLLAVGMTESPPAR